MEEKVKLAWEDPRSNRGYVAPGRERVTQETDVKKIVEMRTKAPDAKETMEIGRDWDRTWKNQWPKEELVPEFKQTFLSFFRTCHELHIEVMRSIAIGLHLEETYFDDKIQEQVGASDSNLPHYSMVSSVPQPPTFVLPPDQDRVAQEGWASSSWCSLRLWDTDFCCK
jgi:isopenicillin N synthase-like dioxygenase